MMHNTQADVLPLKVSQTVITFGFNNILGQLEHEKGLGYLFACSLSHHNNVYGSTKATFVCTLTA